MISLLLAALYVSVACGGNYICAILIDRVGRVKLFREFQNFSKQMNKKNWLFCSYRINRLSHHSVMWSCNGCQVHRHFKWSRTACRCFLPFSIHYLVGWTHQKLIASQVNPFIRRTNWIASTVMAAASMQTPMYTVPRFSHRISALAVLPGHCPSSSFPRWSILRQLQPLLRLSAGSITWCSLH